MKPATVAPLPRPKLPATRRSAIEEARCSAETRVRTWFAVVATPNPAPPTAAQTDLPAAQPGRADLIYIGISDSLRSRLGGLRRAWHRPDKKGHTAAACVATLERQGKFVEVSWRTVTDSDRRELMGPETDLIAAHRRLHGNPACSTASPG